MHNGRRYVRARFVSGIAQRLKPLQIESIVRKEKDALRFMMLHVEEYIVFVTRYKPQYQAF